MDHDRLFEEQLSTFFLDFPRLFVGELAERIEEASLVPLDKEVFTDVTAGERHEVVLLVRARMKGTVKQRPAFFLIHVETQASSRAALAKRMFRYIAAERETRPQGQAEGRQAEAANLTMRLLTKRLGSLPPEREQTIRQWLVERLESLVNAIFEIATEADLDAWMTAR